MDINQLLEETVKKNASDLHISAGVPVSIRIDGELQHIYSQKPVTAEQAKGFAKAIMTEEQFKTLQEELEIDFAYLLPKSIQRFRVNAFHQQHGVSIAFRPILHKIPSIEELHLPKIIRHFCNLPNGLILITGPTGSGKSTTLASMIGHLNNTVKEHIITIEDPIEFVHESKKCLINQREVKRDTLSFHAALRSALREDPDIILVGEMRDLETIRLALTAAETGHLVFATLHTSSAPKTIDRIIDVFPAGEKDMVRTMLSESLRGIVAQTLVQRIGGGRVAASEILVSTPAIRNLIRENKVPQIISAIQAGQSYGMQSLEQDLQRLAKEKIIDLIPQKSET